MAHDIVEQGVDAGGEEVQNPRALVQDRVELPPGRNYCVRRVGGHQTLGVEGAPADEEGHYHGHWTGEERCT